MGEITDKRPDGSPVLRLHLGAHETASAVLGAVAMEILSLTVGGLPMEVTGRHRRKAMRRRAAKVGSCCTIEMITPGCDSAGHNAGTKFLEVGASDSAQGGTHHGYPRSPRGDT